MPNVIDGQSGLALKRKRSRRDRKIASTSSSGCARRLQKHFGLSKRRTCASDVENFRKIVALNRYRYKHIIYYIYYYYDNNNNDNNNDSKV